MKEGLRRVYGVAVDEEASRLGLLKITSFRRAHLVHVGGEAVEEKTTTLGSINERADHAQ